MNKQILLIEDELKTGEMLVKALEMENISTKWITEGNNITTIMEKGKYDLIILDLKLPKMSGEEVLEEIRNIDPYVEVIVYTNYQESEVMKKLINLGLDGYINKGHEADLWETVNIIKNKLDPFTEDERENLLNAVPEEIFHIDKKNGII